MDSTLRGVKRQHAATGQGRAGLIRARLRAGELHPDLVRLAGILGDMDAFSVVPSTERPPAPLRVSRLGQVSQRRKIHGLGATTRVPWCGPCADNMLPSPAPDAQITCARCLRTAEAHGAAFDGLMAYIRWLHAFPGAAVRALAIVVYESAQVRGVMLSDQQRTVAEWEARLGSDCPSAVDGECHICMRRAGRALVGADGFVLDGPPIYPDLGSIVRPGSAPADGLRRGLDVCMIAWALDEPEEGADDE
jgi:hypothetical protein